MEGRKVNDLVDTMYHYPAQKAIMIPPVLQLPLQNFCDVHYRSINVIRSKSSVEDVNVLPFHT